MDFLIVGGGFVGAAMACHLLKRAPSGASITLVNASGPLGRGLAYGTSSPGHLLNVPAARMSWDERQPDDFVTWLRQSHPEYGGNGFVPRRLYGDYLAARLEQQRMSRDDIAWSHQIAHVDTLAPDTQGGWRASLSNGASLQASRVLLALGNFAPSCPHSGLLGLPSDRYVADPWHGKALDGLGIDAPVAIVGSGLTMLDVLASLDSRGHRGPVLVLSRRGLCPQSHRRNELPPPSWHPQPGWLDRPRSLLDLARRVRLATQQAQANGHDWRDVWVALRPHTPDLWRRLSAREQAQFLRHLQAHWDVHRHRASPEAMTPLLQAQTEGRLQQRAGRIISVEATTSGATVLWQARGSGALNQFEAVRIFNCTGPSSRIADDRSTLFGNLLAAGRLQICPLDLGIHVDARYRLLDAQGRPQPGLLYAGPMLRAQHWEATAVPELRQHALAAVEQALQANA
ncbi:FAD/NAD(P)-binding protein [Pelomonas sp. SE-A7]|uniref:FAD/NAD(P)-binding protein n=1 Tax=Pelomonas sp. SE-A7 TaxID=3054953 RepID=UPI00259CC5F2|nr:FAD/NAD(P)-binding protein [Pelomonas sp. SE-A7]MDM4767549.1 FAD/NAD(P)-binding protein [Pelomonas sp. SE-A7]